MQDELYTAHNAKALSLNCIPVGEPRPHMLRSPDASKVYSTNFLCCHVHRSPIAGSTGTERSKRRPVRSSQPATIARVARSIHHCIKIFRLRRATVRTEMLGGTTLPARGRRLLVFAVQLQADATRSARRNRQQRPSRHSH